MKRSPAVWPLRGALALLASGTAAPVAAQSGAQAMPLRQPPLEAMVGAATDRAAKCAAVAEIVAASGDVSIVRLSGGTQPAFANAALCPGDRVETGADGHATLRFDALDTALRLNVDTTLVISGDADGAGEDVTLIDGMMRFLSSVRSAFTVRTALYSMTIDGTEVFVYAPAGGAPGVLTVVEEGSVRFSGPAVAGAATKSAADGAAVFAAPGGTLAPATAETTPPAFHRYLAPDGTVNWAAYYPPALLAGNDPALAPAAEALRAGDAARAEALLDLPPPGAAPADAAPRLALASMIELARGDRRAASRLAERAVAADPDSVAARTARGYAQQAQGDPDRALEDAEAAARLAPDDPFALARLAEIALIRGDWRLAREATTRSLAAGETAYGRAMSGYLDLAAYRDRAAAEQFDRAMALSPGFPPARLGAAFAEIAGGDLEGGRAQLESLAALDPRNARVRTFLGRAYFEEGRPEKARAQFERASHFDPDDPAPHFYAARERFAANRPVAALRELEAAQALGDRRGPVRSARGLAEDDAMRGAAEARVYATLGFDQLSVTEATRAVRRDPTSPVAHRFLAEAYRSRPSFGPARTSELLQSQLFSNPSKTPVQPQLGEANIALIDPVGATRVTFEEFTPLFDRDGLRFDLAAGGGSDDTLGVEGAITALHGPVAVSVGGFGFTTEGSGPNDDVEHRILSAQTHVQAAPGVTLFGEYRYRETDEGDRLFDQINPRTANRFSFDDNRARLGLRVAPDGDSEYVLFGAWRGVDGVQRLEIGDVDSEADGFDVQARHDRRMGDLRLILGGGYAQETLDQTLTAGIVVPFPPFELTFQDGSSTDAQHGSLFAYGLWRPQPWLETTLGLALHQDDESRDDGAERDDFTLAPKAGIEAEIGAGVSLRAAYARTVKRPLLFDETLEPTQVAGFNQVFTDLNGSVSDMVGLGVDWRATRDVWLGAEAQLRKVDQPVLRTRRGVERYVSRDYDAQAYRGYAAWTPDENWSLRLGLEYERTHVDDADFGDSRLETFAAPATARWTHPSGFFAALDATPFHQSARAPGDDGSSSGVILDAALGYRLPDQRGILSLEAQNMLDADFVYQDAFVRTEDDKPRRFSPGFAIIARAALRF